ncbi:hypothetical protein [Streptomyces sp. NPDC048606]|uniref:hypothetical protein n=1 Tax=Streptomyces sp. NPDC048606 TaxID=3154726 RepID=UPI003423D257
MAEEQQASQPRREVVTGVPRGTRRRPPAHTPARSEISEQTTLGETYVRALMRTQLRSALAALAALTLLLGLLPTAFLLPRSTSGPLVWVALGLVVYPVMWLVARWYVNRAERNEADFTGLVTDPADGIDAPDAPGPTAPAGR